jgi:hypothetical protein
MLARPIERAYVDRISPATTPNTRFISGQNTLRAR